LYAGVLQTWYTNPARGQPCAIADVDALQSGIDRSGADLGASVTQVYVAVTVGSALDSESTQG
jgi:hypothetical protein